MDKTNLLQRFAPVGVTALSAISVIGVATAPARAFSVGFHALGWDNGTSQFYDAAEDALISGGDSTFEVEYCLLNPDCEADVSVVQGDFDPFFDDPLTIVPLASTPTATWQYDNAVSIDGFDLAAEFTLVGSPLEFEFISQEPATLGQIVTARLDDAVIEGGRRADDGALEFVLEQGEWEFSIPGMSRDADISVFEFGITSNVVNSGVYDAEGELTVPDSTVPEPATILGLLTISGLGLGLKRKKQA